MSVVPSKLVINETVDRDEVLWPDLAATDTGAPYAPQKQRGLGGYVQVYGTGAPFGGAVTLEASGDGTNWDTLNDVHDNPISFTSAGHKEFSTSAAYLRPVAAAGVAPAASVKIVLRG